MTHSCSCGGTLRRTDIIGEWSPTHNRIMYRDLDLEKANWRCDTCGAVRTQRKRRSKRLLAMQHD